MIFKKTLTPWYHMTHFRIYHVDQELLYSWCLWTGHLTLRWQLHVYIIKISNDEMFLSLSIHVYSKWIFFHCERFVSNLSNEHSIIIMFFLKMNTNVNIMYFDSISYDINLKKRTKIFVYDYIKVLFHILP